MKKNFLQNGISTFEIVMVIAIIAILVTVIVVPFSSFRGNQALQNTTNTVVSLLEQARTQTLSGVGNTNYSVRIESSQAVLFTGSSYDANASTNRYFLYESPITLGTLALQGGGSQITFDRLTGKTSHYGTIELVLSASRSATITVSSTGTVSRN